MERSIFEWSIRALLMAAGTGLAMKALRVRTASVLHRAWAAAMVAMLVLPVWTSWGPSLTARVLPAAPVQPGFGVTAPPPLLDAALPQATASLRVPTEPHRSSPGFPAPDRQTILLAVYLTGFAAMLARLIAGTMKVRMMMRRARDSDGFATTSLCAAPVTIGWLRPILLLPDYWPTWPAAKLEAVLLHEQEHIRRRDPLVQWMALLNRCVFWFHPLAWWLERKLAALAEEACDAAVLGGGHSPHDYARYLIEIARSVNKTGARIRWAGAVAFSTGKLQRRIRRIMDPMTAPATSTAKSIASASLCALLLTTFLACNLGRRSDRAPGQPTMAQLEQRERAAMAKPKEKGDRRAENAALLKSVLNVAPGGANVLLDYVRAHPKDQDNLQVLVGYYQARNDLKSLDDLTLWFIGHHPEVRANWSNRPAWDTVWDKDGYERGKQLWTSQLKQPWTSPFVYMNAAEYLGGNDNEQAEQILRDGQRKFPRSGEYSGLHWEVLLARLYAWALAGPEGQVTENWPGRNADQTAKPNQTPFAEKVRATLTASDDADLLDRTVEQLQGNAPNLAFAQALNARALSIRPDDQGSKMHRDSLQRFAVQLHATTDPRSLSESERMVLLQSELMGPGAVVADVQDTEAKARELLKLASHNTKDPNYGTSVFFGNMALGRVAFSRGDKEEAVRLLLAASEAPATEYLSYGPIDMSLPVKLVDAGEREAVAKFLDRCATFNKGRPLAQWATQIRKGINPRLSPDFDTYRDQMLRRKEQIRKTG